MEELLRENGFVTYLINFKEGNFEAHAEFEVFEVMSWDVDTDDASDIELYLKGSVKWDGCSHIWFGNEGYIHLCGKRYFESHKRVMDAIWDLCSKKIKRWDNDMAK